MLDAASIIAEAERKVGIADSDPGMGGNLERLVEALNRVAYPRSAPIPGGREITGKASISTPKRPSERRQSPDTSSTCEANSLAGQTGN